MHDSYDAKQQITAFCFSSARVVPWLQTHVRVINSIHFNYYFEHEVHWTLKKEFHTIGVGCPPWQLPNEKLFQNLSKGSSVICLIKPGLGPYVRQAASQNRLSLQWSKNESHVLHVAFPDTAPLPAPSHQPQILVGLDGAKGMSSMAKGFQALPCLAFSPSHINCSEVTNFSMCTTLGAL